MNIKQLELFVAIADTGSFSKGAEVACITQSTASQHISTLEDGCGVRLFDRISRGTITTEAGKILLVHARHILKSLKETEQAMLRFRKADGVELSVGGSTVPGTYLLPKAIAALRISEPGIAVRAEIGDSSEILAKLADEHIELGIIGSKADSRHFTVEAVGSDRILLVARKGHHFCGRSEVHPKELLDEPIIMREKGSGTGDAVISALKLHGINTGDLRVCAIMSGSEAIRQTLLEDCGIAFISEMAIREELRQGELVAINLSDVEITRSFALVCRNGRSLSPAAEALCRILRTVMSQPTPWRC